MAYHLLAGISEQSLGLRVDSHDTAFFVDDDQATIVPVNYRMESGDIIIRSLAGAKLDAAASRQV